MTQRELSDVARSSGPLSLGHLPASAQTFVLAALARLAPKQTLLVLAPGVKIQEELANDLEVWAASYIFFPQVEKPTAETMPDPETVAERLSALNRLGAGFAGIILATARAVEQSLPSPDILKSQRLYLVKNTRFDRDHLFQQLQEAGYIREAQVQERGQFSVRGAVVDIFSWDAQRPLRTEWEDEELISLREFDIDAQRSVQTLKTAEVSLAGPGLGSDQAEATLHDYLSKDFVTVNLGEEEAVDDLESMESEPSDEGQRSPTDRLTFFAHDFLLVQVGGRVRRRYRASLDAPSAQSAFWPPGRPAD